MIRVIDLSDDVKSDVDDGDKSLAKFINSSTKFSVDLTEKISIPGSNNAETYRYWWFVTFDKY